MTINPLQNPKLQIHPRLLDIKKRGSKSHLEGLLEHLFIYYFIQAVPG